jgi:hypothetical protein
MLEGHSALISLIAFLLNSKQVVFSFKDKTVRL